MIICESICDYFWGFCGIVIFTVIAKHFEKMLWQSKKTLRVVLFFKDSTESLADSAFSKISISLWIASVASLPRKDGKRESSLREAKPRGNLFSWILRFYNFCVSMDCFVNPCGLPRKDGKGVDCYILANVRKDGRGDSAFLRGILPNNVFARFYTALAKTIRKRFYARNARIRHLYKAKSTLLSYIA